MEVTILAWVGIVLSGLRVVESIMAVLKKEKQVTLIKGIIKTIVEIFKLG